jgi:pimeloyl-ACP methyl ester carboxylesterase
MSIPVKIALWVLAGCIFLLVSGIIVERILRAVARKNYQPDGEFARVGDHQLHYVKKGTGGPTVVFESGLDLGGHIPWLHIQNEISKYTTTISYDRAGILWSERGGNPKTGRAMSQELKELLTKTQCPEPYILVAHSMAGVILRRFIQENKDQIAGIVFIDVTHPNQRKAMEERLNEKVESPDTRILKFFFFTGIYRLKNKSPYRSLASNDTVNLLSSKNRYLSLRASMEELDNLPDLQDEANTDMTFGNIPLTVISSDPTVTKIRFPDSGMYNAYVSLRKELQKDLLNLSARSTWYFAGESGHYVHHCQPEIVMAQIRKMIPPAKTITAGKADIVQNEQ